MSSDMPALPCPYCEADRPHSADTHGRLYCATCGHPADCATCGRIITVEHLLRDPHPKGVPGGGILGRLTDVDPGEVTDLPEPLFAPCDRMSDIHEPHAGFVPVTREGVDTRWFAGACVGARRINPAAVSAALSREKGPRARHAELVNRRQGLRVRGGGADTRVRVVVDFDWRDQGLEVTGAAWQALTRAGYVLVADEQWDTGDIFRFAVYGPFHPVRRRSRRRAASGA